MLLLAAESSNCDDLERSSTFFYNAKCRHSVHRVPEPGTLCIVRAIDNFADLKAILYAGLLFNRKTSAVPEHNMET